MGACEFRHSDLLISFPFALLSSADIRSVNLLSYLDFRLSTFK